MGIKWKKIWADKLNYGGRRNLKDIEYIVLHYTANDGDTADNNGKYFKNNVVKASAHCFVDDGVVVKSVPLRNIAWAVGGTYDLSGAAGNFYGKCTNANSISIEMCDTIRDGKVTVSTKTRAMTIDLVKYYMKKYGVPASHVIRHWDVNGKECPAYWAGTDNSGWNSFKKAIGGQSETKKYTTVKKTSGKEAVCWLQKKLNTLAEGSEIDEDGIWGPRTQSKLEAYWRQLRWKKGSYAGKKTCRALNKNRKK